MSFRIHNLHSSVKIAKEDIVCYKLFHKDYYEIEKDFRSIYVNKIYPLNEKVTNDIIITISHGFPAIFVGIHSYEQLATVYNDHHYGESYNGWHNAIQVKCIIPAGSEYYYNPNYDASTSTPNIGSYVSNAIIVTGEIIKPKKIFESEYDALFHNSRARKLKLYQE